MTNPRRQHTKEFKKESVAYLLKSGATGKAVAQKLGISAELLNRWKRDYLKNGEAAFPGTGQISDTDKARMRELEKQLKEVQEERDILKKALAIFSKKTR